MNNNQNNFVETLLQQKEDGRVVLCQYHDMLLPYVCAFLNSEGGWIVADIKPVDAMQKLLQHEIVTEISPQPLVYVQIEQYEDRLVLLVTVMKGCSQPYSYGGKFYVFDKNNEAVVPDADEMRVLLRKANGCAASWETSTAVGADVTDIDIDAVEKVIAHGKRNGLLTETDFETEKFLSNREMVNYAVVKNAAIALFGYTPTDILPQCRCRIQVMLDGKTAERYDDMRVLSGNVFELADKLHNYFSASLPRVAEFSNKEWARGSHLLYPLDVLDEAVINALVHRDMSNVTSEITIFIFRDYMQIINDGALPDGLMNGKSRFNAHISTPRNPVMAEVLHVADMMEKTGRGMQLISSGMTDMGYKAPEWVSKDGSVILTIYLQKKRDKLPQRAYDFLQKHEKGFLFSRLEYQDGLTKPVSDKTAKADISLMQDLKLITAEGKGPSTKYRII